MITARQAAARYGAPSKQREPQYMRLPDLRGVQTAGGQVLSDCLLHVPRRIYCNKDLMAPLLTALGSVVTRGHADLLRTWDGCFNVRRSKGSASAWSLHAWGLAVDINAAWNGYGKRPTMPKELVACFKDAGFDWGGDWQTPDGMHFQLARFPE